MNDIKFCFFPFTFIPQKWAQACMDRFGPAVVYQPAEGGLTASMQNLAQEGKVELRCPVKGDDRKLTDLAKQFQSWGQVHYGTASAIKPHAESGFYNQEFAPEISNEILKGEKKDLPDPDPMFAARLFLLIAQEYDRQAEELENRLNATQMAAKQMFAKIKGQNSQKDLSGTSEFFTSMSETKRSVSDDPGAYMTEARIRAWMRLAEVDPDLPPLWITSSRAVIDTLEEHFEPLTPVENLSENVLSGPVDDVKTFSAQGTVFYKMSGSGRIIGLLPCGNDV